MSKHYIKAFIMIAVSVLFGISAFLYESSFLSKVSGSFTSITALYILFGIILDKTLIHKVPSKKVRYKLRKVSSLLLVFASVFVVARIWITDTGVLVAAYGFVAAAVAFSIQDFFKNFVGGLILLLKGNYKVGDRVMIKEITGDVIDISLLYTSLLEIEGWVAGDQPTGRIVMIPNSVNLSGVITNYTEDHTFIWDEMHIPVPYGSDWEKARDIIKEITNAETDSITQEARPELEKLRNKYFLSEANIEPSVYIKMTDNWISLHVRYITKTHERRIVSNILSQKILKALNEAKIEIASATMEVTVKNR